MKRTKLLVAAAAAAVLALAACGSTEGTPSAQESTGNSQSSAQQTDASDSDTGTDSETDADADADADSEQDTDDSANTDDSASDDDADVDGAESEDGSTVAKTTTTISGDLDAQTAAWFSTMCTGAVTPLFNAMGALMGAGMAGAMSDMPQDGSSGAPTATQETDPKALKQELVGTLRTASDEITDTVGTLKSMPPPSLDLGDDAIEDIATQMQKAGSMYGDIADELESATVTDMASLGKAITELDTLANAGDDPTGGLDFDEYELDDDTQAAIMTLPACEDALGPFAELGDMGETTTGG